MTVESTHNQYENDVLEAHEFFTPADRYELLREEIAKNKYDFRLEQTTIENGPIAGHIEALQLPLMQAGALEPWPSRLYYSPVESLALIEVPQCAMLRIDTNAVEPYTHLNMSECSAFVAHNQQQELLVAHIGLSETHQAEAALAYFSQHGVAPQGVYAILSSDQNHPQRLSSIEDCAALGISPENCHNFRYEYDNRHHNGLVEVVVGRDGILVSQFNAYQHEGTYQFTVDETSRANTFIPTKEAA